MLTLTCAIAFSLETHRLATTQATTRMFGTFTPKVQDFADFLRTMRSQSVNFYLEGFTFDPRYENGDGRVALEGIVRKGTYSAETGFAFAQFVAPWKPDELSLKPELLRAWWD